MAADELTRAQKMAVERPGGPILVSAAAGSGKTRVIVERLMHRILDPESPCDVNDFLIITFTKKAAAELRTRIAQELAKRLAQTPDNVHLQKQQSRVYLTKISTVHAFCADLLREFACELDIPADFRIVEEMESTALQNRLVEELMEDRYEDLDRDETLQALIDGLGAGRDDSKISQLILEVYRTAQCRPNPLQWLDECERRMDLEGVTGAEQTVWGRSLLQSFTDCVRQQIRLTRRAQEVVERTDALTKYREGFACTLQTMETLAGVATWEEAHAAAVSKPDFGKLKPISGCSEPELKDRVKACRDDAISRIRTRLEDFYADSDAVLADLRHTAGALHALFDLTRAFTARYSAEKRRLHGLDFNDLEHGAIRLLLQEDGKTPTDAARRISARFREVMVDEYQDTNQVQDSIFRAVSAEGRNRFMVGDVKQSIYRFRLADPTIFLQKYQTYPDASQTGPAERQRILLSDNFRSGPAILEAANAVFSACMSEQVGGLEYGPGEALYEGCPHTELPQTQVELHCLQTVRSKDDDQSADKDRLEAEYVARRIRALLDGARIRDGAGTRPVRPGDIVILMRSPKNAAAFYLDALHRLGIPAINDAGENILDTAEVETLLCVLKALDNVHQDIPLIGALLSPVFGVSASDLARAAGRRRDMDLCDALQKARAEIPELETPLALLDSLREDAQTLPLHVLLERITRKTELESVYGAMPNGAVRLRNLHAFYELAAAFSEGGKKSLHQFLDYVRVLKEQGRSTNQTAQTDAVTLMTIHHSKGLEFPVVVLSGLSKQFNQDDLKKQVQFHSELGAGCSVYDPKTHTRFPSIAKAAISQRIKRENASEELRILYVAMTRARDMLIMTDCSARMDSRLKSLASRIEPDNSFELAADVNIMGDWVLQTALRRTEAGALHEIAGKPAACSVSEIPWHIEYHRLQDSAAQPAAAEAARAERSVDPEALLRSLHFRYPHAGASQVPSKLTATQLKGRSLDEEASDGAPRPQAYRAPLRKLSLLCGDRPLTPAQKGTAIHQAMQYLDFSRVGSLEEIRQQLQTMADERFLTPQQAEAVPPEKLLQAFRGELGTLIRSADRVIREFKFSILTDAAAYYPQAEGEELMLQGVTDCCLIRNGEITVIDFKTDRVRPGREPEAGERYRGQLQAYSLALSRIFGLPVAHRLLYFFATDRLLELEPQDADK